MTINELGKRVDEWCERKGWNENLVVGNIMANLHSEVSEAWEEIRNGRGLQEVYFSKDDKGRLKPEGFPIELADLLIRLVHITGHYGIDLEAMVEEKMHYNETRAYRHGGKTA